MVIPETFCRSKAGSYLAGCLRTHGRVHGGVSGSSRWRGGTRWASAVSLSWRSIWGGCGPYANDTENARPSGLEMALRLPKTPDCRVCRPGKGEMGVVTTRGPDSKSPPPLRNHFPLPFLVPLFPPGFPTISTLF